MHIKHSLEIGVAVTGTAALPSFAAKAFLRQFANSASMLVWMIDANDVCTYLNQNAMTHLGKFEDFDICAWVEFIHPDDVVRVGPVIQKAKKTRSQYQVEYRILKCDGTMRWMMDAGAPRFSDSGEFLGYSGAIIDISDRYAALEQIAKSETEHRLLLENSSDLISHFSPDDGVYLYASPSYQQVLGFAPAELTGTSVYDQIHPDDVHIVRDEILKQTKDGSDRTLVEFRKRHKSGHFIWLATQAKVLLDPVTKEKIGVVAVSRDITEGIETAQKLARLAEENKALIENSLDVLVMLDSKGRILRVNAAGHAILGYSPEELEGQNYRQFLAREDLDRIQTIHASLRTGKNTVRDMEFRWVKKDGSLAYLSSSTCWSDEHQVMYVTTRDVTERHHARTALQKSRDELVEVFESIGDAFYALDRDWRVTYVNQKTADFMGIPKADLFGKSQFDVIPDFQTSSAYPYFVQAIETGVNTFFEAYFEPVGAWVEVRLYPHTDGLSVFFHDITECRKTQKEIRAGELRLRNNIDMTPAGYMLTNAQGVISDVNPAMCGITGYAREELLGRDVLELLPSCPLDGALFKTGGRTAVHGKEAGIKCKDGRLQYLLMNVSIERDAKGQALSMTAFVTDITERKLSEVRLEQLANHDTLTGLPNRALINTRLRHMLEAARPDDVIAVMFIDLDRFKDINDSMGHGSGDALLQEVAKRLGNVVRGNDIIARLGGDEFICAAHCTKGLESAAVIARKLLFVFSAPFDIGGREVFVSASMGVSIFPHDGATNELLFQNADTAMYRAKAAGRNGYCFFEPAMSVEAKNRMTIEHDLRRALERNEFELYYQPKIDLKTKGVTGMEALIRWNHPQLGRVSPLQFIPIAEELGFIEAIGNWVLRQACFQTNQWIEELGRPLTVSINLSARQLKCPDLVEQVKAALSEAHLPANLLELELTETTLIQDMNASVDVLKSLKKLGVRVAIDDFGTGYSSLSYLGQLPVDVLKLDQSFVLQQSERIASSEFIKAFVDMAHALKLRVVAEGIETAEILQLLITSNCDEGQGYYFAKPLPLDEFQNFLSSVSVSVAVEFPAVLSEAGNPDKQ